MKKNMVKRFFVGAALSAAVAVTSMGMTPSVSYAAEATVGYVNVNAVLASYPAWQKAQKTLLETRQNYQKEFAEKSKKLDDKAKAALEKELNEKLAKRQHELMDGPNKKLTDSIASVAKTKGIAQIVRAEAMLYGGVNLTKDVITAVNK